MHNCFMSTWPSTRTAFAGVVIDVLRAHHWLVLPPVDRCTRKPSILNDDIILHSKVVPPNHNIPVIILLTVVLPRFGSSSIYRASAYCATSTEFRLCGESHNFNDVLQKLRCRLRNRKSLDRAHFSVPARNRIQKVAKGYKINTNSEKHRKGAAVRCKVRQAESDAPHHAHARYAPTAMRSASLYSVKTGAPVRR
eukprot:1465286-Pleurochrysis_carterae.AAC.1